MTEGRERVVIVGWTVYHTAIHVVVERYTQPEVFQRAGVGHAVWGV